MLYFGVMCGFYNLVVIVDLVVVCFIDVFGVWMLGVVIGCLLVFWLMVVMGVIAV